MPIFILPRIIPRLNRGKHTKMAPPDTPTDWNKIMAIATVIIAIGTVILAIVAIFGRAIYEYITRPKLKISVIPALPHCRKTFLTRGETGEYLSDAYGFRIWVENKGIRAAKNVEVFASKLWKQRQDESYKLVSSFNPDNLIWSNLGAKVFPAIHKDAGRHCDIFHIIDPLNRKLIWQENDERGDIPIDKAILSFDTRSKSNTKDYLQPPGRYRLEVMVSADNAGAFSKILEINLNGEWYEDEERMLTDGVGFKLL